MALILEQIEVFVTRDGSKFERRKDAIEHVLNGIGEDLDAIMKADETVMNSAGSRGVYYMLLALMGNEEKLETLLKILRRHYAD
jgi:hypothetical protein